MHLEVSHSERRLWSPSQVFVLTALCLISFSLAWINLNGKQHFIKEPLHNTLSLSRPLVFSLPLVCGIIYTVQMCSSCLWSKCQVMWRRTSMWSTNNTEALCNGPRWHSNKQNFCKWYRFGDRHLLAPTQKRIFLPLSHAAASPSFSFVLAGSLFSLMCVSLSFSPFLLTGFSKLVQFRLLSRKHSGLCKWDLVSAYCTQPGVAFETA